MKRNILNIAIASVALAAVALTSCKENEIDPKNAGEGKKISFSVAEADTRTEYDAEDKLQINWTEGDKVRIFCDEAEGDVKKADYTVAQISKNSGKLVYNESGLAWGSDDEMHDFYAVYPADDDKIVSIKKDGNNGVFNFKIKQNQICEIDHSNSNSGKYVTTPDMSNAYMIAHTSARPDLNDPKQTIILNFRPIMTTLEITVRGREGSNTDKITLTGISIINEKATYIEDDGTFTYQIKKENKGELISTGTQKSEAIYVGIRNKISESQIEDFIELKSGEQVTFTVFLPPIDINASNPVKIKVHATGSTTMETSIDGRSVSTSTGDKKPLQFAASTKGSLTLPYYPTKQNGNNWITPLDDNIYVQQLSIPGTHDAAAWQTSVFDIGKTQALNFQQQWEIGIRAFDMRTAPHNKGGIFNPEYEMWMYHGVSSCSVSLKEAMDTLETELSKNNKEFAILQIRHENETPCVSKPKHNDQWDATIYKELKEFYDRNMIVNWRPNLTIGDCRGKFIILTRDDFEERESIGVALVSSFPYNSYGVAKLNSNNDYHVQDFYQTGTDNGAKKIQEIKALYEITSKFSDKNSTYANSFPWALNHTSGYTGNSSLYGTTSNYQENAANVNKPIFEALSDETKLGPTGIVFMDWVGTEKGTSYVVYGDLLPQAIIDHNYKYRMLRKGEKYRMLRKGE